MSPNHLMMPPLGSASIKNLYILGEIIDDSSTITASLQAGSRRSRFGRLGIELLVLILIRHRERQKPMHSLRAYPCQLLMRFAARPVGAHSARPSSHTLQLIVHLTHHQRLPNTCTASHTGNGRLVSQHKSMACSCCLLNSTSSFFGSWWCMWVDPRRQRVFPINDDDMNTVDHLLPIRRI